MEKENIFIGLSWPYANGELHIGHLGSSLPADVLARYFRLKGKQVCFVSGSDSFGTPISIQAQKEGKKPQEISQEYHQKFVEIFNDLGFSFDNYTQTNSQFHIDFAKNYHKEIYNTDLVYKRDEQRLFCNRCNRFLPDRYVIGKCPQCKSVSKGDCCEHCGKVLEPEELLEPKCLICGESPELKDNFQFCLRLSQLENKLKSFFEQRKENWTQNAINLTQRYFNEGLIDRAISRDLDWGVPIPVDNLTSKVIYNWGENILGYLSACKEFCENNNLNFDDYFKNEKSKHYYIHAKDNIQFHSIIFPGLLIANPHNYHLPDYIFAYEFVTNEGEKISKSKGTNLSTRELLKLYDVDFVRFYFAKNISDKKDLDFSKQEFINSVNGELINNWGNFVNRTLSFIRNKFDSKISHFEVFDDIKIKIEETFKNASECIEQGKISSAVRCILSLVTFANRYFNETAPWQVYNENKQKAEELCYQFLTLILNIAILLNPIIPEGTTKILNWLSVEKFEYQYSELNAFTIKPFEILYTRI